MPSPSYSGKRFSSRRHLHPHAAQIKVAHSLMLRAIAAAKKKNDRVDASKIADCLGCDFLPECHMASTEIRDRRRTLRYRQLLVRQMVQTKNRISGLLMETGVTHNKQRLHKVGYFRELLASNEEVSSPVQCSETAFRFELAAVF
jgi:transposase